MSDSLATGSEGLFLRQPKISFAPRDIATFHREDGTILLRSRIPLGICERHLPSYLRKWALARPDHDWLIWRKPGFEKKWSRLTYREAAELVDRLTQGLLDLELPEGRPLFILSDNSARHALITFAAMQARIPVAPIPPAWSTGVDGYAKLSSAVANLKPAAFFFEKDEPFREAISRLDFATAVLISGSDGSSVPHGVSYQDLEQTAPTDVVARSVALITEETIAKIMFTSGSTGSPKAVIQTHGMLCSSITMYRQCYPRDHSLSPMQTLSWLPWSHIMGANGIFLRVLADGGQFYMDDGKPTPALFQRTLKNLEGLRPTHYANVPLGYQMLLDVLEHDQELASSFFSELDILNYGGSTLPNSIFARFRSLSERYRGKPVVFTTAWGSTEMGPTATAVHWDANRAGLIGLPSPGMEMKLVPFEDRYELRVKGPSVTSGYYGDDALTKAAFDSEGYYRSGDLGSFVDQHDPSEGILYAGRLAESFKLNSGTYVQAGAIRLAVIAAASPLIEDAVVTAPDRPYLGLLVWLNEQACRSLIGNQDVAYAVWPRLPK